MFEQRLCCQNVQWDKNGEKCTIGVQSSLSISAQKYFRKCEDIYFILQKKYLWIYKDSFGAKILRDDCALSILIRFTQQTTPHFEFVYSRTWCNSKFEYTIRGPRFSILIIISSLKKVFFPSLREFINYRVSVLSSLGHPTAPTNYELL